MQIIARIQTDFPTKFGVPRQSGLASALESRIVFEPEFRNPDALRGIEDFTHIWLIWQFDRALREGWSPTVLPPKLGGKTRVGVFATRSPFRPNAIGLSSVTLEEVCLHTPEGPVLIVGGADLMDGTPIYDIKPYLPYVDSHPDARGGFSDEHAGYALSVHMPEELRACVPQDKIDALLGVLAGDPRPSYQSDPDRVYGVAFAGMNVKFQVDGSQLHVIGVEKE